MFYFIAFPFSFSYFLPVCGDSNSLEVNWINSTLLVCVCVFVCMYVYLFVCVCLYCQWVGPRAESWGVFDDVQMAKS